MGHTTLLTVPFVRPGTNTKMTKKKIEIKFDGANRLFISCLLNLNMSRRLMGDSKIHTQYPCGKMIEMAERDAVKWQKMHFRVCGMCKNAIQVDISSRTAGGDTRMTKNGNVCRDKPMPQQAADVMYQLKKSVDE